MSVVWYMWTDIQGGTQKKPEFCSIIFSLRFICLHFYHLQGIFHLKQCLGSNEFSTIRSNDGSFAK